MSRATAARAPGKRCQPLIEKAQRPIRKMPGRACGAVRVTTVTAFRRATLRLCVRPLRSQTRHKRDANDSVAIALIDRSLRRGGGLLVKGAVLYVCIN